MRIACSRCGELSTVMVICDGPPSHKSGRFVEVECPNGHSIWAGEWTKRSDGYWSLAIQILNTEGGDVRKIGDRVGAILSSDDGVISFIGYGVYQGSEIPQSATGFMAETLRDLKMTNPKILLDNGKVVWGCECWWGSEAEVQKMLEGKKVINVDIESLRLR